MPSRVLGSRYGLPLVSVLICACFSMHHRAAAAPAIAPGLVALLQGRQDASAAATSIGGQMPDFALNYAPYVYLSASEQWFPADIVTFLDNVVPVDSSFQTDSSTTWLANLNQLPEETYLSSLSDFTQLSDPSWLNSEQGRPNEAGYSIAPSEIIVAHKDGGITDVFYFFFYAFNQGPEILGQSIGDHVGDWEHTMVRFDSSGTPTTIYLSQHDSGTAYEWNAITKMPDGRPVVYAAYGDHPCYPTPGEHQYSTVLSDNADAGMGWDVALNYRAYSFDSISGQFASLGSRNSSDGASSSTTSASLQTAATQVPGGTDWLTFKGYWGDQQFRESDRRQFCIFGHCKYSSGPQGPYLKNLGRKAVCQDENDCVIHATLD